MSGGTVEFNQNFPLAGSVALTDRAFTLNLGQGKNVSVTYQMLYNLFKTNLDIVYRTKLDSYTKAEVDNLSTAAIVAIAPADEDDEVAGLKFPTVSGTYTNFGGISVQMSDGLTVIFSNGSGVFTKTVIPIELAQYLLRNPSVTREKLVFQFPDGLPEFSYNSATKVLSWTGRIFIVNGNSDTNTPARLIIGAAGANTIDFSTIMTQDSGRHSYVAYVTMPAGFMNSTDLITSTINGSQIKFVSDRISGAFDPAVLRADDSLILFQLETNGNTFRTLIDGFLHSYLSQRVDTLESNNFLTKNYILGTGLGDIGVVWLAGYYSSQASRLDSSLIVSTVKSTQPIPAANGAVFTLKTQADSMASGTIGKFVDSAGDFIKNLVIADLTLLSTGVYSLEVDEANCVSIVLTIRTEYLSSFFLSGPREFILPKFIDVKLPSMNALLTSEDAVNLGSANFIGNTNQKLFRKGGGSRLRKKLTCLLVAGQSNTDGRAAQADAPTWLSSNNNQLDNMLVYNKVSGVFEPFRLGFNTGAENNTDTRFAYDLFVAKNIIDEYGLPIYIIKCSLGGTSIDKLVTTSPGHWDPFYEDFASNKRKMLDEFSQRFFNAVSFASSAELEFQIKACLWHQGESDNNVTAAANNYQNNFSNVITYIRGLAGNPVLPFIFGNIPDASTSYNATIRTAQETVAAADVNTHLIDIADLSLFDGVHLNAANQLIFANRIFSVLNPFL